MTQAELEARVRAEGLDPSPWANGPGEVYAGHEHRYDKVLVVAAGSIRFGLSGGDPDDTVALSVGDRLDLPAGIRHDAVVGPQGVTCLEAHLGAGALGPTPLRRPAGSW
jgi:uncharacterized protein YjlB